LELLKQVTLGPGEMRIINLCDSRVVVGFWANGRSSSRKLNNLLRKAVGLSVAGRIVIVNLWVGTKWNPADAPSRERPMEHPGPIPKWCYSELHADDIAFIKDMHSYHLSKETTSEQVGKGHAKRTLGTETLFGGNVHFKGYKENLRKTATSTSNGNVVFQSNVRLSGTPGNETIKIAKTAVRSERAPPGLSQPVFREIFAGCAHLSRSLKASRAYLVARPYDAHASGHYRRDQDILVDSSYNTLQVAAAVPNQYWHFGLPCDSFSIINVNLNHGTRSHIHPQGDGTLARELRGNEIMRRVVKLINILEQAGNRWSLENPRSSYLFRQEEIVEIIERPTTISVVFDQCMYGLTFPDAPVGSYCRKSSRVISNLAELEKLHVRCDGTHDHIHAIGSFKDKFGWHRRTKAAGAYPPALCAKWARICKACHHGI
jgi:hypothetical protein